MKGRNTNKKCGDVIAFVLETKMCYKVKIIKKNDES